MKKDTEQNAMSEELESFCISCVSSLAAALDVAIRVRGKEYEAGFNLALDLISKHPMGSAGDSLRFYGIPNKDRPEVFAEIIRDSELGSIPYNKLSPLNQLFVTIPSYVFYCLNHYLPRNRTLQDEAKRLMNTPGFPRYLQEQLGVPIAREINGAFGVPTLMGRLASLLNFGIGKRS
jgi:hypothetical protein